MLDKLQFVPYSFTRKNLNSYDKHLCAALCYEGSSCGPSDGVSYDDYKVYMLCMKDFPYRDDLYDLCQRIKDQVARPAQVVDFVENFVRTVPVGDLLRHIRKVCSKDHGYSYLLHIVKFFMLVLLECYGQGVLFGYSSANETVAFYKGRRLVQYAFIASSGMSPSDLKYALTEDVLKSLAKSQQVRPAYVQRLRTIRFLFNNVEIEATAFVKYMDAVYSGKVTNPFFADGVMSSRQLLETTINVFSTIVCSSVQYAFRDLDLSDMNRIGHCVDILGSKAVMKRVLQNPYFLFYNELCVYGLLNTDSLYNRETYIREDGVAMDIDLDGQASANLFVREAHNIDGEENHLVLVDAQVGDGIYVLCVYDMSDLYNGWFLTEVDWFSQVLTILLTWYDVIDKTIERMDEYAGVVDVPEDTRHLYAERQELFRDDYILWIRDALERGTIVYQKPKYWNYDYVKSVVSKSGLPAFVPNSDSREIKVARHTRKLPEGYHASESAKLLAKRYFISLEGGKTFVEEFTRKVKGEPKTKESSGVSRMNLSK